MAMQLIRNTINWVRANKVTTVLLIIVIFLLYKLFQPPFLYSRISGGTMEYAATDNFMVSPPLGTTGGKPRTQNYPPQPDITDRKVITESNLSLLVKDVEESVNAIKHKVVEMKGYVVQSNVTKPEFGVEGYIILRVPVARLDEMLAFLKNLSVKVVSENISGTDITDQYEDIAEKLRQLERTKVRFEQIMAQAQDVNQILQVQREILSLQSQIDQLKGRRAYLDGASSTTLITINLSTDELGLPYAPTKSWRPEVVFKQAVRSLIYTLRDVGSAAIWLLVYLPAVLLGIVILKAVKSLVKKALNRTTIT